MGENLTVLRPPKNSTSELAEAALAEFERTVEPYLRALEGAAAVQHVANCIPLTAKAADAVGDVSHELQKSLSQVLLACAIELKNDIGELRASLYKAGAIANPPKQEDR